MVKHCKTQKRTAAIGSQHLPKTSTSDSFGSAPPASKVAACEDCAHEGSTWTGTKSNPNIWCSIPQQPSDAKGVWVLSPGSYGPPPCPLWPVVVVGCCSSVSPPSALWPVAVVSCMCVVYVYARMYACMYVYVCIDMYRYL